MASSFAEGSSRVELNTTSDRHDRPTPYGCSAWDSRDRGRRYCEKNLGNGEIAGRNRNFGVRNERVRIFQKG
ncbi:hypothetical protein Taro_009535 [Colocasia esculenta]|uniref:Uncharacterized protein n=1 Tax=Colocasia esculenta TaxID=4460 RepID=A0A843U132_COLES|nr:hypothetical protein [Colocasia esculenta]